MALWAAVVLTVVFGVRTVVILVPNRALRRVLERLVAARPRLRVVSRLAPGIDVLLATAAECPAGACREFSDRGTQVVIFAPVPTATENRRYLEAGAVAYVPMEAGLALLDRALTYLDEFPEPGPIAAGHGSHSAPAPLCLGPVEGVCGRALAWLAARYPGHEGREACPWHTDCPLPLDAGAP